METPTAKDGTPLKRIEFEGAQIYVLPHVSEIEVIEKFKRRHRRSDWSVADRLSSYGSTSRKGFSADY